MAFVLQLLIALLIFVVVLGGGVSILRLLGRGQPTPPPAGEMRKVNLRYRCDICGAELRMTLADEEMPEAPRHCQDEMRLVTPVE
ncbi:MAG: hypothetical protein JO054_18775 [Actinobacteria bacterium]|nr:hypothetical protein [Actinomycetota bacterium]MBV9256285.1 hypothetical protein [Actinomycetota bacterium]